MARILVAVSVLVILLSVNPTAHAQQPMKPTTYNVTLATPNTEVDWVVPVGTKKLRACARGAAAKMSWQDGQSGTTYQTIPANQCYCAADIVLSAGADQTAMHFQSASAPLVIEVEVWR